MYTMSNCLQCTACGMYVHDVFAYTIVDIEAIEAISTLIYEIQFLIAMLAVIASIIPSEAKLYISKTTCLEHWKEGPPWRPIFLTLASLNVCIFYTAPTNV